VEDVQPTGCAWTRRRNPTQEDPMAGERKLKQEREREAKLLDKAREKRDGAREHASPEASVRRLRPNIAGERDPYAHAEPEVQV
jgi:hypothetical protein